MIKSADRLAALLIAFAQKVGATALVAMVATLVLFVSSAALHQFSNYVTVATVLYLLGFAGITFTFGLYLGRRNRP